MNITVANLGWTIAVLLIAGTVLGWVQDWMSDRYEITRRGFRFRVTRRWYGAAAHISLRSAADDDDPDRFTVLARWDGDTVVPWLLVHRLDREYLTYWDEDAEAFWAPVTDFAPYALRRVRPHLARFGRVPVPWLTKWCLEPPSGADLGELSPAAGLAGDELELAPAGLGPLVPGEPGPELLLQHGGEAGPPGVGDELDGVLGASLTEDLEVERARSIGHGSQGTQRERG